MVRYTASIDTSFLAIPSTFLHDLPSLAYVTTKLFPLSYQLVASNATISRHSSPSCTLRELCYPCLPASYRSVVIFFRNFEAHKLTYEQWRSVLHLSTRWGFASLRKLALKSINPPTPHDQLLLARTYSVEHWVLPALTALCSRTMPLSLDEARQMSIEDVILVATVREEIRGRAIRADVFDISHHVEKAQAGKLNPPVGSKVYGDKLKCGITGRGSDLKVSSGVDPNVETEDIQPMGVTSPSGLQPSAAKEGDTDESHAGHSSKEVPMESPGVKGTSKDCLKKSVATPAVQTTGARKFEDTSRGAAEWPIARAVAENHAVTAMEGQEAKAKADAEARARAGVEAKVKAYAEARARAEAADAEAKARAEEEAKAKADAEVEARAYAEARARAEVAEADAKAKANAEAEAKAKANAEAKAHAIARVRAEAEAKAKADAVAEAKAKANAEAKARSKARAKAEAEAKAKEAKARAEAEAKARAETEAKARIEAEAKTKADAEAKAKVDAEARAKAYAEARARAEADAKARAEEEAKAKADAEAKAKAYAEARARAEAAEAEAKARAEEEAKAKAEVDAAAAKAELGAKKADKERLEIEARDKAEAARGEYEWCTQ